MCCVRTQIYINFFFIKKNSVILGIILLKIKKMGSPELQKCSIEDWNQVLNIAKVTFENSFGILNKPSDMKLYMDKAFSAEQTKMELNNPNSVFYFVTIGEVIVGYFKLNWADAQTESIEGGLEVERIYLLAAYQGLNIGQLMMYKIFEIARKKNLMNLWLGVWEKNEGAIRFYERNGFSVFSKHNFLLGTDLQTDLLMELKLEHG